MANSIQKVTENCFRVLLDPIPGDSTVTIGFSDHSLPLADLSMVAPEWQPYELDGVVSLQDSVLVHNPVPTTDVSVAVPISVVKTGTTHLDFEIAIRNETASEGNPSAALEIYIELGGH
jgi:hypothetical protein